MKILLLSALAIAIGYAVLFYRLSEEGIDVFENLEGFGFLPPILIWGVELTNWVFGTAFDNDAWVLVWIGLFAAWTLVAIWFVIDEPRKRRQRSQQYGEFFD